ncbi:putative transcription regulator protein [Halomonas sp. A3H3]|uniref:HTH-type transcriptional regulator YfiR n=2 Tax=root TaxID=1 RepID=A0AAP9NNC7_9GAMM|nr:MULTISPECIES: TetR/AcrR family transcriptional regulator [unclassified Halomonas]QKS25514.1 putative HTH-type transcriptional regulator YfiR [Halomonas titanicae]CDG53287.1 putative transcription regulator protein [Halomonas sp. A3H3]HDZ47458.1 TetR/AcrR family transcriptional regulator [Halomonas sp.]SDJ09402.1 transcriptional regulator, TetR family [Halomonas titanicae]HEB05319.1 TetR/AcrR family transcriptional regulator [Halomonas sp.]|tara:strand:- start:255 stop:902 length:648 start_codon:yes stop_codon:yes gene_type:complete
MSNFALSYPAINSIRKHRRLPSDVRIEQILRAALVEFSQHGFSSARMEDIAQRAELSKGGLYAHFKSKESIFEALLLKRLTPSFNNQQWVLTGGESLNEAIKSFIDHLYGQLSDPDVIATLKLLLTESRRIPHLVDFWRREIIDKYLAEQQAILKAAANNGHLRHSAFLDDAALLMAPALYGAVWQMIFDETTATATVDSLRHAHTRMLHELLAP